MLAHQTKKAKNIWKFGNSITLKTIESKNIKCNYICIRIEFLTQIKRNNIFTINILIWLRMIKINIWINIDIVIIIDIKVKYYSIVMKLILIVIS